MNYIKLETEIRRDEGLRQGRYLCPSGCATIGVGHRILPEDGPLDEITLQQAGELLAHDISIALVELSGIFPLWHKWSERRQHALVNMMFNLGAVRFRTFKKMIAAIEAEDWKHASEEIRESKYYQQVGPRAERIREAVCYG